MWVTDTTFLVPNPYHRYKDAERDSSFTLTIQKDNVKALFRRGQARMHLENFEGSQGGKTPILCPRVPSLTIVLRFTASP
jgi:hypothetical protein